VSTSPPLIPAKPGRSPAELVLNFLSSFGLATVTLVLLLIIVLLGTFDQVDHGLFESQKRYFESAFAAAEVWDIRGMEWPVPVLASVGLVMLVLALRCLTKKPIPSGRFWLYALASYLLLCGASFGYSTGQVSVIIPGGYLLMLVLTVNITIGALRRIRKTPSKIGILIAHFAVVFILLAGAVSFYFKKDGNLALIEGQTSDEFQSYHDSVIEIERTQPASKDGKRKALVISGAEYKDLTDGKARVFTSKDLPFDLMVINYMENCTPKKMLPDESKKWQVDGVYLQPLKSELEQEVNLDGATVQIKDKKGGPDQTGLIWRGELAPYAFKVGDEVYNISIGRRSWKLPFAVRLDKAERENHPGTRQARRFASDVTKMTGGHEEKKHITMNEPLRDSGYVLFQSQFAQTRDGDVIKARSVFAVVQNPSDQWPLYGLFAAIVGLLLHLVIRFIHMMTRPTPKISPAPAV